MDRIELLKLALEASKGDPEQALALAREMAAFVEGEKSTATAKVAAPKPVRLALAAPVVEVPSKVPDRWAKSWTEAERTFAEQLYDQGVKVPDIAARMGRTVNALQQALYKGRVAPRTFKVNSRLSEKSKLAHLERKTRPDARLANGLDEDDTV